MASRGTSDAASITRSAATRSAAESEKALASSFAGIFRYLRGEDAPEPADPARLRDSVLTELSCTAGRWLLVLDNCADERLADAWMPKAGEGHVIVTTLDSGSPP